MKFKNAPLYKHGEITTRFRNSEHMWTCNKILQAVQQIFKKLVV